MTAPYHQRNQEATIWCGNLDAQCSEELVFELFLQVGPVSKYIHCLVAVGYSVHCLLSYNSKCQYAS
jgi:RNA recognition motif-containing protein